MKVTSNSSGGGSSMEEKSWPPGFRFHPTDEELVLYYLKRKICRKQLRPEIIGETNVYKWDPDELPGQSLLKSGDRQWFFFSPRDRKYPNGGRSKRATRHGYWKATGKDRHITCNSRIVGVIKTLVYYEGRAPTGERTDWVMHEYTMDEEELKRCQTAQDYYAIYKVYKKSGAGPKNGEQYGAPFREEEWADDDCFENHNSAIQENLTQQLNGGVDLFQLPDDMDEILKQIIDEPEVILPHNDKFANPQHQVGGKEETQSTVVEPSLGEAISFEPSIVLPPCEQQYDVQTSFGLTHSAISYLQSCEAPEVTSAPNIYEKETRGAEEDFLEINDLLGPEPSCPNSGNYGGNWQTEERNGLDDPDLYFDAAIFLHDIGPINQGIASHPYFDSFENDLAGKLDYQLPSQPDVADHPSSPLWVHDQRYNVFESTESSQVVMTPPVSGMVSTNVTDPLNEAKQNHENNPWFTSKVWSFLESIPTHPAAASENVLINQAFERMSSFGRIRVDVRNNTNVVPGERIATERRATTRKGGFFFLSILGFLCALLWMLMVGQQS